MKKKLIKKTINFTERMLEMLEEIGEEKGLPDMTAIVHVAISETHGKLFKYTGPKGTRVLSAEEEAEDKMALKDAQKGAEEKRQKKIAQKLDGKLIPSGSSFVVEYFTYAKGERYPQRVPLANLTDEMVDSQYFPSREMVENLQKEGKINYSL